MISATTHGVREHAIGGDYWGTHYLRRSPLLAGAKFPPRDPLCQ